MNRQTCSDDCRFWVSLDRSAGPDACWPYMRARTKDGYGQVKFEGAMVNAQRVAWIKARGDFDRALRVCHRCDNPPCCNPDHLFLGTHADNMNDMDQKGRRIVVGLVSERTAEREQYRLARTRLARAKLDDDKVREIRRRHDAGEGATRISRDYAVSPGLVRHVIKRRAWTHVV